MSPGGRARSGSTDKGSVDLSCVDGERRGLVPSRVGGGHSRSGIEVRVARCGEQ